MMIFNIIKFDNFFNEYKNNRDQFDDVICPMEYMRLMYPSARLDMSHGVYSFVHMDDIEYTHFVLKYS